MFSFIRLRGRCRFCQAPISRAYPIVELVTAISFVATGVNPFNLIFISTLIVIFFSDWIYGLIPDQTVILLSILGLARYRLDGLAAGVVAASLLAMLIVITRGRGLGWGDVKLSLAMGLLLGPIGLMIALWIGFVSGGLAAVLLLLLRRKKMRDTMALGPYLVVGIWAAYFYGDKISTLARL